MNNNHNISKKIERITGQNRLKKDEIEELDSFINDFDNNEEIEKWLQDNWQKAEMKSLKEESVSERYTLRPSSQAKSRKIITAAASVAAVVIITLVGGQLFFNGIFNKTDLIGRGVENGIVEVNKELKEVVLERGGRSFNLSHDKVKIQTKEIEVVGSSNNLKLLAKDLRGENLVKQQWSTLKIPKGKDYYVILSDSTQVWLNACSELTFPDCFVEGKREVILKGEGYFIVKSNIHNPFFVRMENSTVQVTGTKFNVCSYSSENTSYITLQEGKVGVEFNGKLHQIKPGEQFVQHKNGDSNVKKVDPISFISWVDGRFEFGDMALKDMALRLEKWYDVKFEFSNEEVSKHRFTGMIKKEHNVKYFINILQKTTDLSFTLQGSKIVVSTKTIEL